MHRSRAVTTRLLRSEVRYSAIDALHREAGAKMVSFGGWEMPLAYPTGTLAEHEACRTGAAIFDVSHLGTVRVEGSDAFDRLQTTLSNDLGKIGPGRAQYTHLLDDHDASVVDDIIVWWIDDAVFDVMPNASNTDGVTSVVGGVDTTATRCVFAVQGPSARDRVASVSPEAASVGRFTVGRVTIAGFECTVAGTGYTGEDGVEIAVPIDGARTLWTQLVDAGCIPAGLGARDTLRLEAALPLHGHELGPGITPLQAGLEWVVSWSKPTFRGRDALAAEKSAGVKRLVRGISIDGRRPARDGTPVLSEAGERLGTVTSGNFSPTLGHCVALALLDPEVEVGDTVVLDVRGTAVPGRVTVTPFVRPQ